MTNYLKAYRKWTTAGRQAMLLKQDTFIDDELFSDSDKKRCKALIDVINAETDVDDIFFDNEPIDTTQNVQPASESTHNFSDILLPKNNVKTKAAEIILKSYKK